MRSEKLRSMYSRADRRCGLITTEELHRCQLSDSAISRLAAERLIFREHRAVYRVAGTPRTLQQRALAACLACGEGAAVSGRTAAELWRLLEQGAERPIDVIVPRGRRGDRDGISVCRASSLPTSDVTMLGLIPITRIPRTLRDFPKVLKEDAFDEAIRQRRITPREFIDERGYLGKLARDRSGLGVPHEKIERKAIALLKKLQLPPPKRQHWVSIEGKRYRIDLAYPDKKIAIELLGEAAHWGRERFQRDIDRRNALEVDGWREFDFSWFDVTRDTAKVERVLRAFS